MKVIFIRGCQAQAGWKETCELLERNKKTLQNLLEDSIVDSISDKLVRVERLDIKAK